jgi:hypothetical protein
VEASAALSRSMPQAKAQHEAAAKANGLARNWQG